MAVGGEGFVIPARVVVSVEGLAQVKAELQKFAAVSQQAAAAGRQPSLTPGGPEASVRQAREAAGARLNDVRQAALLVRQELARSDITAEQRTHLQGQLKDLKAIEGQIKRNTEAARTQIPERLPGRPIYPTSEPKYPTIAAQEQGKLTPIPPRAPQAPYRPAEPVFRDVKRGGGGIASGAEAEAKAKGLADVQERLEKAISKRLSTETLLTAEGREALEEEQALTRTREQVRAVEGQIRAEDKEFLAATAALANSRRDEANRVKLLRAGQDPANLKGAELRAAATLAERAEADRARALAATRATKDDVDAAARLRVANRLYEQRVRQRQQDLVKSGIESGEIPRGDWFQRLQTSLQPASGRLPEENLKLLQFTGDKLQRSLGYAASGLLIGMGASAIAELYRDATQLEVTFVRLRGQLDGIGEGAAFGNVREQIRGIAADTGQASNDVALFFSRMVGLTGDPASAMTDTASAMKLMTVTGLDMKNMLSSVVPIAKAFDVSAEEIGNEIVAMGEKFGIAEDDLLQFLGKTSVVAKQAGLNFQELTIIGANMANSLGKPIESASESINKVTGQLELNMQKIFQILQANPRTAGAIPKMIDQFAAGAPGQALIELLKVVDKFDPSQRNQILTNVVSRREAEDFNAIISNAGNILEDLQDRQNGVGDTSGRLEARFRDLKETVQVTFQTINAAFESLGEVLLRTGLGDAMRDIGNALTLLMAPVGLLASAFTSLNEALSIGGQAYLLSGLTRILGVIALAAVAQDRLSKARQLGVVATDAETGSEARNTGAKQGNLEATTAVGAAQARLNEQRALEGGTGVAAAAGYAPLTGGVARGMDPRRFGVQEPLKALPEMRWLNAAAAPGMYAGVQDQALQAAEIRRMQAAEAALITTGFAGRAKMLLPRFGEAYTTQLAGYSAALKDVKNVKVGAFTRAAAGGRFLRAPGANAMVEAERAMLGAETAATGLMASPLLTGAIFLVAAAYIKTQYDDLKARAESDEAKLKTDLRNATAENVRMVANTQSTWAETFIAGITGTSTIPELGQIEQTLIDSSEMRRSMGGKGRPERAAKMGETTANYVTTTQKQLNERWADTYSDAFRKEIQNALLETREGAQIGIDTGVLGELSWIERQFPSDFRPKGANIAYRNEEATAKQYAAARQALLDYEGPKTPELQKVLDKIKAEEQGKGEAPALNELQKHLMETGDALGYINSFGGDVGAAFDAMNTWQKNSFKSLNELNSMLASGEISEAEYVAGVSEATKNMILAGAKLQGPEGEAARVATREALKARDDATKAVVLSLAEFDATLTAGTTTTPKIAQRDILGTALKGLPERDRIAALPQMLQADLAAQEEILAGIPDPNERLEAALRGINLSDLTISTSILAQFKHSKPALDKISAMAAEVGAQPAEVAEQIAAIAAEQRVSLEEAIRLFMIKRADAVEELAKAHAAQGDSLGAFILHTQAEGIRSSAATYAAAAAGSFGAIEVPSGVPDAAKAEMEKIDSAAKKDEALTRRALGAASGNNLAQAAIKAGAAQRNLDRLRAARNVEGSKVTDEDIWAAEGANFEAQIGQADALFNLSQLRYQRQVILANRDPVLENAAKMAAAMAARNRAASLGRRDEQEAAEQQILQLQQEAADNQLDIARGAMAVQSAIDAEDPLKSAINGLKAAEFELANAHGDADREQKQAQVIEAQRALANAVSAGISADAELAISLATLRDDPVSAATLALQEAQRKLDEAKSKNINDRSVIAPLEDQIAQATKAAFLAPINKQIEDLDFLYGMEQIALSQYVAGLQAQLQRLQVNSKEYRDLALKIHNLQKQGEQDLQFNLPTTLGLPTLYEARRVTQSSQLGIGYQDNRNISMIVNVNGAQDPMTITNQIVGALTAVSGMASTPFTGVGV